MQRLPEKQALLGSGGWREQSLLGRMVSGRTIGLVGFGRIGQAVAHLLKPWRVRLLYHDPAIAKKFDSAASVPLDTLLAESDVVSLHAAAAGTHIIGRPELARMKPDAVLVNTARGSLVDEEGLAEAIESGRLGGAALDVFAEEPLPMESRLRRFRQVILTPHSIGHTVELMRSLEEAFIVNLRAVLAGEPPEHVYNPAALPRWRARFGMANALRRQGP